MTSPKPDAVLECGGLTPLSISHAFTHPMLQSVRNPKRCQASALQKKRALEMFGARFFNTAGANINEALPLWKIRDA
jgi:hypothetical protein